MHRANLARTVIERAAPRDYTECVGKVNALIEEYGELGVMAMIRAIDAAGPPDPPKPSHHQPVA